jgi:hypothetical protein
VHGRDEQDRAGERRRDLPGEREPYPPVAFEGGAHRFADLLRACHLIPEAFEVVHAVAELAEPAGLVAQTSLEPPERLSEPKRGLRRKLELVALTSAGAGGVVGGVVHVMPGKYHPCGGATYVYDVDMSTHTEHTELPTAAAVRASIERGAAPDLLEAATARALRDRQRKLHRLAAEFKILRLYDHRRELSGHDYGAGQRARELRRRRWELDALDANWPTIALEQHELAEAFARVGAPRLERSRIYGDASLAHGMGTTKSSRRTFLTWTAIRELVERGAV